MNEKMVKAYEFFQKNDFQVALKYYEQEIQDSPSNALAYQGAAICLANLKDYEKAIDYCNKALAINSDLAIPHLVLAETYQEMQKIPDSRKHVEIAYKLAPNLFEVILTYGTLLLRDNKVEEGITILERAAQTDPDSYAVHYNLSQAYLRKKDLKNHYLQNKEIFRLRPTFAKGLRVVFAYTNIVTPIISGILLVVTFAAILTKLWILLVLPFLYMAYLVIGSILLRLTRK